MSGTVGAAIVLAFGALDATLCGYNIQGKRYALAGFQAFGALFALAIGVFLLVTP